METDISTLPDAWRMAVRQEEEAHDFYIRLAQRAADESLKALFRDLAAEEAKHRQRLEKEYRRLQDRHRSLQLRPGR